MTMRTEYPISCPCGHQGSIKMSENDQPYSKPWEKYTLFNLIGNSEYYVEGSANWDIVFQKLAPSCPKCKRHFTKEDFFRNNE